MGQISLAIIGTNRLAEELLHLSHEKGFKATLYPDGETISSSVSMAVETLAGTEEEKRQIIRKVDSILAPSSVILTSCLDLPTTAIASWTGKPERVVGFATFYPLKQKRMIELAGGLRTREDSLKEAEGFFQALGKATIRVKDTPGLVFPRILSLIINEAARSLDEGVARAEEIDVALRLGTNYPLGPLRWADQIGLDEVLAVLEGLQRETGDDRYRPTPLLKKMVRAGRLGEISGQGFYPYRKS
ncbi:MAG: 3-hydroxyacyl-CoA dehydrogenase family protein [Candidatus Binatia bacterium]